MNERQRKKTHLNKCSTNLSQCSHSVAWCGVTAVLRDRKTLAQKLCAQALMELIVQKALITAFPAVFTRNRAADLLKTVMH